MWTGMYIFLLLCILPISSSKDFLPITALSCLGSYVSKIKNASVRSDLGSLLLCARLVQSVPEVKLSAGLQLNSRLSAD
jgi:hypothetical protein